MHLEVIKGTSIPRHTQASGPLAAFEFVAAVEKHPEFFGSFFTGVFPQLRKKMGGETYRYKDKQETSEWYCIHLDQSCKTDLS